LANWKSDFPSLTLPSQIEYQGMLIIDAREAESIDKALKNYKKKFEKAGILRELRRRQSFTKPSIERRTEILKAEYRQQMQSKED